MRSRWIFRFLWVMVTLLSLVVLSYSSLSIHNHVKFIKILAYFLKVVGELVSRWSVSLVIRNSSYTQPFKNFRNHWKIFGQLEFSTFQPLEMVWFGQVFYNQLKFATCYPLVGYFKLPFFELYGSKKNLPPNPKWPFFTKNGHMKQQPCGHLQQVPFL